MKTIIATILLMLITFTGNAQWATFTPIQSGTSNQSIESTSSSKSIGYELDDQGYVRTKYNLKIVLISRNNTEIYKVKSYKELGNSYAGWWDLNQDASEIGDLFFSRSERIAAKSFTYYVSIMGNKVYFNP